MRLLKTVLSAVIEILTFASPAFADLTYTFDSNTAVAFSGTSYTASGALNLSLGFAPKPGTDLTVVKLTGISFISGTFNGVPQGGIVPLSYNGTSYDFIANYYGGNGRTFVLHLPSKVQWSKETKAEIMKLLAEGKQSVAEEMVTDLMRQDSQNMDCLFLNAVFTRSRFEISEALPMFARVALIRPDSPEGLVSACIMGIDLAKNAKSALSYYNALLALAEKSPDSIPIHWMAAVMARHLSKNERLKLGYDLSGRIQMCGIREYETVLALMKPGIGPCLVHQTMANLLDGLDNCEAALPHREMAAQLESAPWSLQAKALTLMRLGRFEEALPLIKEVIQKCPDDAAYYHNLANISERLGMKEECLRAWDKACELEPNNQTYLKDAVIVNKNSGNYEQARKYTRQGRANDPRNLFFKVWDARLSALLGDTDGPERVQKAGLIDYKDNPSRNDFSKDAWFLAVQTGNLKKVRELIPTADLNAHCPEDFGKTALMQAASAGWEPIAAELIKAGAKLDEVDANGDTALHYSTQYNNTRIMKLLLDAGANPDILNKGKDTPLIICTYLLQQEGFDILLNGKAGVNVANPAGGPLHYAAGFGQMGMVKSLIQRGADVNAVGKKQGETPLFSTCGLYHHSHLIAPLVKAGANVNAKDREGWTPLHRAINPVADISLIEQLLANGADPTVPDKNGITPVTRARILGLDELALKMEQKAGRPEPFHFPKMEATDATSTFMLPVQMGLGIFVSKPAIFLNREKAAARTELESAFGISNGADLHDEIRALDSPEPPQQDAGVNLPTGVDHERFTKMFKSATQKIHALYGENSNETAWANVRIIYLAGLGEKAGFLDGENAAKMTAEAAATLNKQFSSQSEFLQSFLLGIRFHEGWDAVRYQHICQRILDAALPWSDTVKTDSVQTEPVQTPAVKRGKKKAL